MSVWTLNLPLTPGEEESIMQRTHLPLPYHNLPDLTHITTQAEATRMLRTLHPSEPPESLHTMRDKFWNLHAFLQTEDLIAIPLPAHFQVAIAKITGPYQYHVGPGGTDLHLIPVTWPASPVPMQKFRKHHTIFSLPGMREVTDRDARLAIYGKLPHGYNRFDKWKWLFAVFMLLGAVRYLMGMLHAQ